MDRKMLVFQNTKRKVFSRLVLCRHVFGIILVPCLLLLSGAGTAGEITIPWTVDLFIPSDASDPACVVDPECVSIPAFDASYTALEVSPPFGPDRIGLDLVSQHNHSYSIHLPFEITISAPDQVRAGQTVGLDTSAVLVGTPSFTTHGTTSFSTQFFADSSSVELGNPPNEIGYGGLSLTVAGNRSYTDTDTTAKEVLSRTKWEYDPWGNRLLLRFGEIFEGYELHTTGDMDAWGGDIQLLEFVGNFFSPAAAVGAIVDLAVGPEFDIVEETYLTTQFVTGYYTDDGGITYDDFVINSGNYGGSLPIPDTLSIGDTYSIQMFALGLGFNTLFEYMLQGNIDVELEILSGLFNADITEIALDDAFLVDSWIDRFQYVQFLQNFLSLQDALAASLTFEIIPGPYDDIPPLDPPALEMAEVDPFIEEIVNDPDADQGQQGFYFPNDPDAGAAIDITAVPEPATFFMMTTGLFGLLAVRRRRKKTVLL